LQKQYINTISDTCKIHYNENDIMIIIIWSNSILLVFKCEIKIKTL